MRKGFETQDKAQYYEDKAESIENNNAIFSDDPQALDKLKEKLNALEERQAFMKAVNKCVRKKDKEAFLKIPHATEEIWQSIHTPDCFGGLGFADYKLRNNNANIVRIKKRIAQLEKLSQLQTEEITINGVRLIQNVEANRLQLVFADIPDKATREELKGNGFRWCRSEGAWQRHLTSVAVHAAKYIAQKLNK